MQIAIYEVRDGEASMRAASISGQAACRRSFAYIISDLHVGYSKHLPSLASPRAVQLNEWRQLQERLVQTSENWRKTVLRSDLMRQTCSLAADPPALQLPLCLRAVKLRCFVCKLL